MQPPEPGPAAVFIERLHVHVAHAEGGRGTNPFGQKGLGSWIPVEDRVLRAFFVVDHELQRDPGLARPLRVGRLGAVAIMSRG